MSYNSNKGQDNYPITLLKAVGLSFIVNMIFIIILAIILTFTSLSVGVTTIVNSVIMILSISFGSIYISLKADKLGWLNGAAVGLIYIIIIILLGGAFLASYTIDIYVFFRIIVALVTGSVGGMIGINLR